MISILVLIKVKRARIVPHVTLLLVVIEDIVGGEVNKWIRFDQNQELQEYPKCHTIAGLSKRSKAKVISAIDRMERNLALHDVPHSPP